MHADLWPLGDSTSIANWLIGNQSLESHQREWISQGLTLTDPMVWLSPQDRDLLLAHPNHKLLSTENQTLALYSTSEPTSSFTTINSFIIRYPWDLLRAHESFFESWQPTQDPNSSAIHPLATVSKNLQLGEHTRILPGVVIEGSVIIGDHCTIGPNAFLRGPIVIGNHCRIGQAVEIKNSIIGDNTSICHLSYVGDSIIDAHCNLGAGTIISNFRHDATSHQSLVNGTLIDTKRLKFGTIIGAHTHTGIHTSVYPGRKLAPHTHTRPHSIIQTDT